MTEPFHRSGPTSPTSAWFQATAISCIHSRCSSAHRERQGHDVQPDVVLRVLGQSLHARGRYAGAPHPATHQRPGAIIRVRAHRTDFTPIVASIVPMPTQLSSTAGSPVRPIARSNDSIKTCTKDAIIATENMSCHQQLVANERKSLTTPSGSKRRLPAGYCCQ